MAEDTIQSIRDLVRPVMTILLTLAYIGIIFVAAFQSAITGKEALTAIGTPFMMVLTYHFAKSSKKDTES